MTLEWTNLPALFPNFPAPERWLPLLQRHQALIAEAAPHTRVSAVDSVAAIRRQYAESLEILRIVEAASPGPATIVDVGSGGGFPGLVIAVLRPEVGVHLVEPLQKRAQLLSLCALELGLKNVTVHAVRAEEAGRSALRDAAPVVTARTVAKLRVLLEYTTPLAAPGGLIALPKGSGLEDELGAAGPALAALACTFERTAPMRSEISTTLKVALFRKLAPAPHAYPRRPGGPAKRPL